MTTPTYIQQKAEEFRMVQARPEDSFLTLSVRREGMGENDFRPAEPDDILKALKDVEENAVKRTEERVRRETLKELIQEQQSNELDGKGYDFYFAIRSKLDASTPPEEDNK